MLWRWCGIGHDATLDQLVAPRVAELMLVRFQKALRRLVLLPDAPRTDRAREACRWHPRRRVIALPLGTTKQVQRAPSTEPLQLSQRKRMRQRERFHRAIRMRDPTFHRFAG